MARKDAIEVEGKVVELLPNTMFRVEFPTDTGFGPYFG
jgi:translation initiation factor IF-1